jgi:hypothetical protein
VIVNPQPANVIHKSIVSSVCTKRDPMFQILSFTESATVPLRWV